MTEYLFSSWKRMKLIDFISASLKSMLLERQAVAWYRALAFVGTGTLSYIKKIIYWAGVSQRLKTTALSYCWGKM
jgi:hypothetical protein